MISMSLRPLFGTTVTVRALSNAILFKARIAFAAWHQNGCIGQGGWTGIHLPRIVCENNLLAEIVNIHSELSGD